MADIKTTKMNAIKALINEWLKDHTMYCNNCDLDANPALLAYESCCENPQIGRNIEHYLGCVKQNKAIREFQLKETGATENNNLRHAVSLPPRLLFWLEGYFDKYGEKLFNNRSELHAFMKRFPQFNSCEKV
jgi:hypothetical protein